MKASNICVYITPEILKEIILYDDTFVNLHSIFKKFAVLLVDMTDEEWDQITKDEENDLLRFAIANDVSIIPLHDFFSNLSEDETLFLKKPRSLFFLDIPVIEAETLSRKYGMLIQSKNKINDRCLQWKYSRSFQKNERIKCTSDGWSKILEDIPFNKGNAVVITDNYLFTNQSDGGKFIGCENLKYLLDTILPKELSVPFHILIVSKHPNSSPRLADGILTELKSFLAQRRDFPVKIEMVFDNTIHPRKLIGNYYVMTLDKGFQLFKINNIRDVYDNNELKLESICCSPDILYGDSEYNNSENNLLALKKLSNPQTTQHGLDCNESHCRTIGDCKPDKSLINRLINN